MTVQATTPRVYTVQRLKGEAPLRRNHKHLRIVCECFPAGPFPESNGEEEEGEVVSMVSNNAGNRSPGQSTVIETIPPPEKSNVRRNSRVRKQTEFFQSV